MSYEKSVEDYSSLTTWQMVNKLFENLKLESCSLVNLSLNPPEDSVARINMKGSMLLTRSKIGKVISFLHSILIPNEEFSSNMASLYDWYTVNLDKVVDLNISKEERRIASENVLIQVDSFLDIWRNAPRVN